eukprot:3368148-Pyramimonas_sp.AAC.1
MMMSSSPPMVTTIITTTIMMQLNAMLFMRPDTLKIAIVWHCQGKKKNKPSLSRCRPPLDPL